MLFPCTVSFIFFTTVIKGLLCAQGTGMLCKGDMTFHATIYVLVRQATDGCQSVIQLHQHFGERHCPWRWRILKTMSPLWTSRESSSKRFRVSCVMEDISNDSWDTELTVGNPSLEVLMRSVTPHFAKLEAFLSKLPSADCQSAQRWSRHP